MSVKRVYRIWRWEGLKVPKKQPKRGRLWLNDGSCIRLRPEKPNHVWSYDFMQDHTEDGRRFRMLTVIDEYARQPLPAARALRTASLVGGETGAPAGASNPLDPRQIITGTLRSVGLLRN